VVEQHACTRKEHGRGRTNLLEETRHYICFINYDLSYNFEKFAYSGIDFFCSVKEQDGDRAKIVVGSWFDDDN